MEKILYAVGGINTLIIGSILAYVLITCIIVCAGMWLYELHQNKKAEREAEAAQEAEALIGADATPSLMYQRGDSNDEGSISGMFLAVCLNGGVAPVVEGLFHDPECEHPCPEHPECALAG